MLEASRDFPEYEFIVAKAPSLPDSFYENFITDLPNVRSVENRTYEVLLKAKAALVTSGTATLETALFGVPEVVCYKGSSISYQIARRLIKVKFISLVNLIMGREVVKELIQNDLTKENLKYELDQILNNEEKISKMKNDYADLKKILSDEESASAKAAKSIYRFLKG